MNHKRISDKGVEWLGITVVVICGALSGLLIAFPLGM